MATMTQLRYLPNHSHRFVTLSQPWRVSSVKLAFNIKSQSQSVQSSRKQRRPENVAGEFFVDHTCIDCDTCRWMAPEVFTRVNDMSAVKKQPSCQDERLKALQALLSCPTSSISTEKPARDILEAQKTFPLPIDIDRIPGVYHCGYHSDKSYGAASYLIVHPEGNILVDSPRYTERLASNIEKMGGVRYMFLTHKDDVADHEKWSKRFKCERVLHSTEVQDSTRNVEIKLDGSGPWDLGEDIQLIHTPGHTEGSVCLFYKPLKALFTGDHLALEDSQLYISERYNFYSVPIQLDSVAMLLKLDFEWILPGHGRRVAFKDVEEKNANIKAFLATRQRTHAF
ncbi:metallo-beta-lactamase family protein [Artemisia annua]|uniref:Metallo-beta-lactamase family protein n=1 Tax=Artemisia annua TaxID=35608 RepID=A0A2U1N2D3_ARTAN|nr:metallo-beta-lactamase family protein [Artemisia annua]